MAKTGYLFIFLWLIPLILSSGFIGSSQVIAKSPKDINILILTANGIGETYFVFKEQFEAWGWNVTTAGLSYNHTGCPNQEPILVASDILISEISNVSEYECIFIPSGALHHILRARLAAWDIIKAAYNEGLVISTLCVSTVILADAGIIDGVKVTGNDYYDDYIEAAGGIFKSNANVVSDKRIITGAGGSGGLGGYVNAPTYELCVAIAKELLGDSYVLNTIVTSSEGILDITYEIKVEIVNQTDLPLNISSSEISRVYADIYRINGNYTYVKRVELSYADNFYIGSFKDVGVGNYTFVLEVINKDEYIEVVRNTTTLSIESTIPPSLIPLASLIFVSFSGLAIFLLFYLKKFKR